MCNASRQANSFIDQFSRLHINKHINAAVNIRQTFYVLEAIFSR